MSTHFLSPSRNNWMLVIFNFLLFVYIHLPLTLRFGYSTDEILDYRGTSIARDTYLAVGRWGIVAWNAIVSDGMKPWSGGITAGIILSIALLIQTKILFPKKEQIKHKFIYCTLYLASCQFAYMLFVSMQVEAVALSVLFASLSCYLFYDLSIHSTYRYTLTIFILLIALSCYQTSGLVFFALTSCKFMTMEERRRPLKTLFVFAGICVTSISLFFFIKFLIHTLHLPSESAIEFIKQHEASLIKAGILNPDINYCRLFTLRLNVAFQCNLYIILSAIISFIILIFRFICTKQWMNLCTLAIAITGTFFSVSLTAAGPAMYFFLPIYASFILVQAIADMKLHPYIKQFGYALLGLFCIYAAHKVAGMALDERTRHETNLLEKYAQCLEARRLQSSNQQFVHARIVIFENGWNKKAPNFYNSYPFININLASQQDYMKHKEVLESMPSWPAKGSIREHKGDIIIKGTTHW